ncbi:acyltransferase domain-containing protein, partial [Mycobacterium angelicum]|uniref:acyltransferase domain-containing protein n=1 Tax=Mycobacterium angelicum TaxID=470074 RepID=UPI0021F3754C
AITTLLAQGPHTFVELSPHPVLAAALTDTLADQPGCTVVPTLVRDLQDLDTMSTALAQLHTHGHSPDWTTLYPGATTIALPTYPFQHRPYWTPCPPPWPSYTPTAIAPTGPPCIPAPPPSRYPPTPSNTAPTS